MTRAGVPPSSAGAGVVAVPPAGPDVTQAPDREP